jgi:hypothetical protein
LVLAPLQQVERDICEPIAGDHRRLGSGRTYAAARKQGTQLGEAST